MTEVGGPYYMYTNGKQPYDRVISNRRSVLVRGAPSHEVHTSQPTEYWRRTSAMPGATSRRSGTKYLSPELRRISRRGPSNDNVGGPELIPVVRQKHLYSEPTTRRRTRYLSESPRLSRNGVRIYDVNRSNPPPIATTTTTVMNPPVSRVEYVPVSSRTRSISTSRILEAPVKSYRVQTLQSAVPPKPREVYAIVDHNNPSRHSLPVTTEYDPYMVQSRRSVKTRPQDRSKVISIYHLDQPQNMVTNSSPDVTIHRRTKQYSAPKIIETKPSVSEVTIRRAPAPSATTNTNTNTTTIFPIQTRSVSALPVEISRQPDPPYPVIEYNERRASTGRVSPYPRESVYSIHRVSAPSIPVPPRMASDVSSIATGKQNFPEQRMISHNSNVYFTPTDSTYIVGSSGQMNTKGPTRSKIRTTIEHEIPLSPVVPVTVWSEQNAIKPIHVYDTHQNTLLNGTSKHSKINQMGPPMLFSDLESDSSSTESVSNIYQIVSPDTAVKPVLKQYIQTHPYTVQPRVVHSTVEIQDDSYDPAQHLQPNGLVTLLNPNDPDGPTVTDQGPVYLYATRVKHNDHKSHYSD